MIILENVLGTKARTLSLGLDLFEKYTMLPYNDYFSAYIYNYSSYIISRNKISGCYIYFLQTYSPKPYPLMTSFFQTEILSISRHYAEI